MVFLSTAEPSGTPVNATVISVKHTSDLSGPCISYCQNDVFGKNYSHQITALWAFVAVARSSPRSRAALIPVSSARQRALPFFLSDLVRQPQRSSTRLSCHPNLLQTTKVGGGQVAVLELPEAEYRRVSCRDAVGMLVDDELTVCTVVELYKTVWYSRIRRSLTPSAGGRA